MSEWPKREDGSNKKIGEMTREESRSVFKAAGARVQKEFEGDRMQEKLRHILDGDLIQ